MDKLGTVGFIGRFKPLHKGAAVVLDELCQKADYVKIGIGSVNKYNLRNPFTAQETKEMIDSYLKGRHTNYEIIMVPDFAHLSQFKDGQLWRHNVKELFGNLDYFVTGNDYVKNLMKEDYNIIHPAAFVPEEKWVYMKGSIARIKMAQGADYKKTMPKEVSEYLQQNGLIERFRKEFGLETLTTLVENKWHLAENKEQERAHTYET